ncbi:MAG: type II toxin-antitoxin system VapC family toxin [Xanthomonadales bacterium]|nr:type II toxin-antitoxin system VapC family toxin [Xanthomonadales bacterium]
MGAIRTHLFDASALVKLFLNEDGSEKVKKYFNSHSVFWTTSLCFGEVLGVFKRKFISNKEDFTKEQYLFASEGLVAYIRNGSISIEEVDITKLEVFNEVEKIVEKYSIDLADAFQIVALKNGFPSSLSGDSKTILITADGELAEAAKSEGLRVWNCLGESAP